MRTSKHWGRVLNPVQLQCATQNARNVTLPSKQLVEETIQRLRPLSSGKPHTHPLLMMTPSQEPLTHTMRSHAPLSVDVP